MVIALPDYRPSQLFVPHAIAKYNSADDQILIYFYICELIWKIVKLIEVIYIAWLYCVIGAINQLAISDKV